MTVPATATLTLYTTLNAALATLDLGAAPLGRIEGTFNASDLTVDAGDAATLGTARLDLALNASDGLLLLQNVDVSAQVALNASSLEVCVPEATGLRVVFSGTSGWNGLEDSGLDLVATDVWQTEGFDAAPTHIVLDVASTVSTFSVERPVACP